VADGWPDCSGHGNVQLKTTLGKVINGEALSVSAHVVAWHAFQSASLAGSREMCVLDHRSHRIGKGRRIMRTNISSIHTFVLCLSKVPVCLYVLVECISSDL